MIGEAVCTPPGISDTALGMCEVSIFPVTRSYSL